MKRSDMILDMASQIVIGQCELGMSPMNFDKAQEIAERLLSFQERQGMHPPSYQTEDDEGYLQRSYYIDGDSSWELENE